ncbi:TPA: hypothetical protein JLF61_001494 [Escherichia coli]|nr:hypothetical protein [Escherichia coli]
MPATASNTGFVMLTNDLLNIEKIAGKVFTGNMKITYSLIQGFEKNGQTAYFSRATLERYLGASRSTVKRLVNEMVEIGLIQKLKRKQGETVEWRTCPLTPEMLGTVEATPAALPEAPQEPDHTAEPVEAPTVAEVKPLPAAPGPKAPITLMTVYSEKVETVDQPGEVVPAVTPYPRGEIKESSRWWDEDEPF